MREIEFRGHPIGKREVQQYGIGAYKTNTAEHLIINAKGESVEVIHLCQYTVLKDCNGNKIFEGDILRLTIPNGSIRLFVVEWAEEDRKLMPLGGFEHDGNPVRISGWCFNWKGFHLYPTVIDGISDNEKMTVIGNIHDNPELLNGVSKE